MAALLRVPLCPSWFKVLRPTSSAAITYTEYSA